ncbi:Retinoic acid early transcript 1E [Galemys pyrenaicus]|uniref:Retinoic acid early transcript 1E n=1 Tax=Galemys pyrenaicus TaxID=202257 RepID=A0A8J5ZVL1_GALPY|nr:Retinoic acid early transcript 1E [Galemys pyrenaicus]
MEGPEGSAGIPPTPQRLRPRRLREPAALPPGAHQDLAGRRSRGAEPLCGSRRDLGRPAALRAPGSGASVCGSGSLEEPAGSSRVGVGTLAALVDEDMAPAQGPAPPGGSFPPGLSCPPSVVMGSLLTVSDRSTVTPSSPDPPGGNGLVSTQGQSPRPQTPLGTGDPRISPYRGHGDGHTLCLNLTVKYETAPREPWCEVHGSVDENPFLWSDCDSHKGTPLGALGEKVKATKTWTDLTQTLGEVGRELRMILPDIRLERNSTRGPPTLQAKLSCWHEAQRGPAASWEFSISGQRALLFDAMSGKWLATDPGASGVKEEWESNQHLTQYLRTTSLADCSQWLQEFLQRWEDMLEPTVPPTKTPENNQSYLVTSNILTPVLSILVVIIIIFFIFIFIFIFKKHRRPGTTVVRFIGKLTGAHKDTVARALDPTGDRDSRTAATTPVESLQRGDGQRRMISWLLLSPKIDSQKRDDLDEDDTVALYPVFDKNTGMALAPPTLGLLLLLPLLGEAWRTVGYGHSLCLNFTVKSQPGPRQPWCEAHSSVDENPFLWSNCDSHKVMPLGALGEKVKATKTWKDLTQTLGEVGRELRMILPDTTLERTSTRGPPTLQAKLSCWHEAQRGPAASWEFSISEQRALLFDQMSGKWSATDPGASGVKEEWESNQQLTQYLRTISLRGCTHWLHELLQLWEDMLEPTVPPTKTPETDRSDWIIFKIVIPVLSVLIVIVIIIIIFYICRTPRRPAATADGEGCSHSSPLVSSFLAPHTLRLHLSIIPRPRAGQPWCEVKAKWRDPFSFTTTVDVRSIASHGPGTVTSKATTVSPALCPIPAMLLPAPASLPSWVYTEYWGQNRGGMALAPPTLGLLLLLPLLGEAWRTVGCVTRPQEE